jgi:nucleolar MIF4G domain-containing protein 1
MAEVDQTYGDSSFMINYVELNDAGVSRGGKTQVRARKEQRKAARAGSKSHLIRNPAQLEGSNGADGDHGDMPTSLPKSAKRKLPLSETLDHTKPAKREKKQLELTLPSLAKADAEDDEIEWLEWMLKKEKEKAAADGDVLSDGLDGMCQNV